MRSILILSIFVLLLSAAIAGITFGSITGMPGAIVMGLISLYGSGITLWYFFRPDQVNMTSTNKVKNENVISPHKARDLVRSNRRKDIDEGLAQKAIILISGHIEKVAKEGELSIQYIWGEGYLSHLGIQFSDESCKPTLYRIRELLQENGYIAKVTIGKDNNTIALEVTWSIT
jgi:hypothetical protein